MSKREATIILFILSFMNCLPILGFWYLPLPFGPFLALLCLLAFISPAVAVICALASLILACTKRISIIGAGIGIIFNIVYLVMSLPIIDMMMSV